MPADGTGFAQPAKEGGFVHMGIQRLGRIGERGIVDEGVGDRQHS